MEYERIHVITVFDMSESLTYVDNARVKRRMCSTVLLVLFGFFHILS